MKRGSKGEVYGNEVALEQYFTYTTEKPEKIAIEYYAHQSDSYDEALQLFIKDFNELEDKMENMVGLVNLYQQPLDENILGYYQKIRKANKDPNVLKIIGQGLQDRGLNLKELINSKKHDYEKV